MLVMFVLLVVRLQRFTRVSSMCVGLGGLGGGLFWVSLAGVDSEFRVGFEVFSEFGD